MANTAGRHLHAKNFDASRLCPPLLVHAGHTCIIRTNLQLDRTQAMHVVYFVSYWAEELRAQIK